jgi:hypothetical protein
MARSLSVEDIMSQIEFEMAQGLVSQDDFGQAIDTIRRFQEKIRSETFKSMKPTDAQRVILSRQYQLNDMLLSLLQEMTLRLQSTQADIKKLRQLSPIMPSQVRGVSAAPEGDSGVPISLTEVATNITNLQSQEEVKEVMQAKAIEVELQTGVDSRPVVGGLLNRLRVLYHKPALFYTRLFAKRQAVVNRTFGDHILYLESQLQAQQGQIEALEAQLDSLLKQGDVPDSTKSS